MTVSLGWTKKPYCPVSRQSVIRLSSIAAEGRGEEERRKGRRGEEEGKESGR